MKDYCAENEKNAYSIFGCGHKQVPPQHPLCRHHARHLLLFAGCFYADGHVRLNDRMVSCRKG